MEFCPHGTMESGQRRLLALFPLDLRQYLLVDLRELAPEIYSGLLLFWRRWCRRTRPEGRPTLPLDRWHIAVPQRHVLLHVTFKLLVEAIPVSPLPRLVDPVLPPKQFVPQLRLHAVADGEEDGVRAAEGLELLEVHAPGPVLVCVETNR